MPPPGESKFLSAKGLTLYFQRYTRIYITPFAFVVLSLRECVCMCYVAKRAYFLSGLCRLRVMCARTPVPHNVDLSDD